jgi:hypothetical protein
MAPKRSRQTSLQPPKDEKTDGIPVFFGQSSTPAEPFVVDGDSAPVTAEYDEEGGEVARVDEGPEAQPEWVLKLEEKPAHDEPTPTFESGVPANQEATAADESEAEVLANSEPDAVGGGTDAVGPALGGLEANEFMIVASPPSTPAVVKPPDLVRPDPVCGKCNLPVDPLRDQLKSKVTLEDATQRWKCRNCNSKHVRLTLRRGVCIVSLYVVSEFCCFLCISCSLFCGCCIRFGFLLGSAVLFFALYVLLCFLFFDV